jgi:hypothetical protein
MGRSETNLVNYGSYDPTAAQKEREGLDDDQGGEFVKIREGRTRLRILPPPEGKKSPFQIVYMHYIKVAGEKRPYMFVCPSRTPKRGEKKHCAACEKSEEYKASGNPADKNLGYAWQPKRRVYCNVIKKGSEIDPNTGEKTSNAIIGDASVWAFGPQVHDQLVALRENPDDPIDFTHPEEGFDIIIRRKGTGAEDTEYKITVPRDPSYLANDVEIMNDLILDQRNLKQYTALSSDEDILLALDGEMPERKQLPSGERGSRRSSGRGSGRGRSRRRSIQDDEADVVDDELDDDDTV